MNVLGRHTAVFDELAEPGLASLLGIAVIAVGGHKAFVAPPHVHAGPVHGLGQRAFAHDFQHIDAVGAAGHGNIDALTIRLGQQIGDGQQRTCRHGLCQHFGIRVYDSLAFRH